MRPDDVPMLHFRRKGDERLYALYDLPGGRVEVPLLDEGFWPIWLHEVAGVLKMTWLNYAAVHVRDLEADAADHGQSLIPFDQTVESLRSVALSQVGGEHVVLLADAEAGEPARLLAGEPWNYQEELPRYLVQCEPPPATRAAPPLRRARRSGPRRSAWPCSRASRRFVRGTSSARSTTRRPTRSTSSSAVAAPRSGTTSSSTPASSSHPTSRPTPTSPTP
ncbi:hypothetical protein [Nannocystis pusilla]|uniref:hypothetical protein n=1 Tax=Nannocystis pusilla TaxID=889268 RepID=UPI003B82434E